MQLRRLRGRPFLSHQILRPAREDNRACPPPAPPRHMPPHRRARFSSACIQHAINGSLPPHCSAQPGRPARFPRPPCTPPPALNWKTYLSCTGTEPAGRKSPACKSRRDSVIYGSKRMPKLLRHLGKLRVLLLSILLSLLEENFRSLRERAGEAVVAFSDLRCGQAPIRHRP